MLFRHERRNSRCISMCRNLVLNIQCSAVSIEYEWIYQSCSLLRTEIEYSHYAKCLQTTCYICLFISMHSYVLSDQCFKYKYLPDGWCDYRTGKYSDLCILSNMSLFWIIMLCLTYRLFYVGLIELNAYRYCLLMSHIYKITWLKIIWKMDYIVRKNAVKPIKPCYWLSTLRICIAGSSMFV